MHHYANKLPVIELMVCVYALEIGFFYCGENHNNTKKKRRQRIALDSVMMCMFLWEM